MDFWAKGQNPQRDLAIWEWEQKRKAQALDDAELAFRLESYSGNAERPGTVQWERRLLYQAETDWRKLGVEGPFR